MEVTFNLMLSNVGIRHFVSNNILLLSDTSELLEELENVSDSTSQPSQPRKRTSMLSFI